MSGMPRRLFQQVHQHPAKVDGTFAGGSPAGLVQARGAGDGVCPRPGGTVAVDHARTGRAARAIGIAYRAI